MTSSHSQDILILFNMTKPFLCLNCHFSKSVSTVTIAFSTERFIFSFPDSVHRNDLYEVPSSDAHHLVSRQW
jgi:hypothetical protein